MPAAPSVPTVVLFGTLDTKGEEYAFLRDAVAAAGCNAVVVDVGVLDEPAFAPDIDRADVARAAGRELGTLAADHDRGRAVAAMAEGAAQIARRLRDDGRLDAVIGVGGSNAGHVMSRVCAALPLGVPKLVVSTIAAGDTRAYVGTSDVTLMYPVVDINGLNAVSTPVLANAAAGVAGMARRPPLPAGGGCPLVGISSFGVTTAGVTTARERLEQLGYEVLVFHATGVGGRSLDQLAGDRVLAGVLDLTTTELADDLANGVCSAGPDRGRRIATSGVPWVLSTGALDMVNFGPRDTVPREFAARQLLAHNPAVTLMRTSLAESAVLGARLAALANEAVAAGTPVAVLVPCGGFSQISVSGAMFHDAAADAALLTALHENLDAAVEYRGFETDINDRAFAIAAADTLDRLCRSSEREIVAR